MRIAAIALCMFVCCLAGNCLAGQPSIIQLTDGSTLRAEIVSVQNGIYTLKSRNLGTLRIDEAKIKVIRLQPETNSADLNQSSAVGTLPAAAPDQVAARVKAEKDALQQAIMNDPETMNMIMSLENDPEIQKILQNPEIMKAVNSGDINALLSNPEFVNLLNNPKIQAIGSRALQK